MRGKFISTLHPNAYLKKIRNVRCGLKARTKILFLLDVNFCSASELSHKTGFSYNVVMHHLRLMYREGIVEHKGSKRYVWGLTGVGQTRLI
ncbi:MAG: winged helix-turn-helix domain-containing protein [Nitrososphaerota archaeon]|nr:winged helix-turn-helix domain-containing protein [Nitrososphaerota archaeon]